MQTQPQQTHKEPPEITHLITYFLYVPQPGHYCILSPEPLVLFDLFNELMI